MRNQSLEIKAAIRVLKPAKEVFASIMNPAEMSNYFISKSSGRLEEGKKVTWYFPEFGEGYPVRGGKIEKDRYISFKWNAEDGRVLLVEIVLTPAENNATVVTVTEKSRDNDEAGILWLKHNTEGWTNFLACLKALA